MQMRTFVATLALPMLLLGATAYGQAPTVGVDARVELMAIIFRLAGNPEYNQTELPAYAKAIDEHFAAYRNHPAVKLAAQLRSTDGVSYDAVMSLAIHVEDASTLKERTPFDRPGLRLDARLARRKCAPVPGGGPPLCRRHALPRVHGFAARAS